MTKSLGSRVTPSALGYTFLTGAGGCMLAWATTQTTWIITA
jgi:hypothetical protein